MKKLIIFISVVVALSSCSTLKTTSTYSDFNVNAPYAVPVVADLDVWENRIVYVYVPSRSVRKGGTQNVVNSAVRGALDANGKTDVLVGLETEIKYSPTKKIQSVKVTGYPAKYKNFRSLDEDVWYATPYFQTPVIDSKHSRRK